MPLLTVESLVMYEATVRRGPASLHAGQKGVSVLVTTLVITLGIGLGHDAGGELGHVPGDVTLMPSRVTVAEL
jgi:hypothetical protein